MTNRTAEDATSSILVTGGAGYIGSHFVNRYLRERPEARVIIIDDLSQGNPEAIKTLKSLYPAQIHFIPCKIGEAQVRQVLADTPVEAVVHFAASALVAESQRDPIKYLKNNVEQSLLLLESLVDAGVRRFVFSSTCAVYGTPDVVPILETEKKAPINVYGRTKMMVEEMLDLLHERGQLSYVALRYFNAAGADPSGLLGEAHPEETHLIPLVLAVAKKGMGQVQIHGDDYETPDGTCIRDYIHINDLADAHIAALTYLQNHPQTGEVFNLGTGQGHSVLEVVETCRTVTGHPIPAVVSPRREGDPPMLVASAEKAKRLLNWNPQYGLQEIVETAWNWERQGCFSNKQSCSR